MHGRMAKHCSHCVHPAHTRCFLPPCPGHVFPGTIFLFWGCHWLLGFVRHYFECIQHARPYRSKTTFRFLWLPERWPLESCVKLLLPGMNMLLEVREPLELLSVCILGYGICLGGKQVSWAAER